MLVVSTADRSLRIASSLPCELYDLTRAEAAVASVMLEGLTAEALATLRGVGRETVRSRIKKAPAKTGCRSQGDFIRRPAPLAA